MRPLSYNASAQAQSGFTLIELITVIILLGIISSIALPRFFDRSAFEARFAADDLGHGLQFARSTAVGSGCAVQLSVTSSGYQIQTDTNCGTGAASFTTPLQHPNGDAVYALSFPASVSITAPATPFNLQFQSSGEVLLNAAVIPTNAVITLNQNGVNRTFRVHGASGVIE